MTKDDILRLAREAGLADPMVFYAGYERFANLVAAAEREACAKLCETHAAANTSWTKAAVKDCAEAIRARGTT